MTLEEFRKIKQQMIDIVKQSEAELERISNQDSNDEMWQEAQKEYTKLLNILLNSDLSLIPFEEWEGMILFSEGELDLSKTHANIDFSVLSEISFDSIKLYGCNVRGIETLERERKKIDEEFKKNHPEYFPDKSLPEEIKNKYYNNQLTLRDLIEYPALKKSINEHSFDNSYYAFTRNNPLADLIKKIGVQNTLMLIDEEQDFITFLVKIMGYDGNYDYLKELDKTKSYEEIKQILLKKLVFKSLLSKKESPITMELITKLSRETKKNYPHIFIQEGELPESVLKDYYEGHLSIEQLRQYNQVLRNKDMQVGMRSIDYRQQGRVEIINILFNNVINYIDKVPAKYDEILEFYFSDISKIINENVNDRLDYMYQIGYFEHEPMYPEIEQESPKEVEQKLKQEAINKIIPDKNPASIINQAMLYYIKNNTDYEWILPLFDSNNVEIVHEITFKYKNLNDSLMKDIFKEYILRHKNNIDLGKTEYIEEVLSRLSLSNSSEIFTFRKEIAIQILETNNPLESFDKVEEIFIKNNLPTVGKIYSCFEILHPEFKGFDFNQSTISPILKKPSTMGRKITVFSDLIKASFGSNNRSVNAYLRNIEIGSNLYESIRLGQIQFDSLGKTEIRELTTFCSHLATLYNNTMQGRREKQGYKLSGNVINDILELSKKLSPNGTLDYNLADRTVSMFCHYAGIDSLEQAKSYIEQKIKTADSRNRIAAQTDMILQQGDFIKGIGKIEYLGNILQNGSVAKEFLGASARSDLTPLDTDISMILTDGTTSEKISATASANYGPIWFVLKNDDRFQTTRTESGTFDAKRDASKIEVFYTGTVGQDHYGIRTGFASSEINYIVMDNYDPRVGLEIAINGFYIPVANKEGKIIFTPEDYDKLREKMNGLSYYGKNDYKFSENLITEETIKLASQIEQSNYETEIKRTKINKIIKESLEKLGLQLKTDIDGDLTEGFVELIDTGSTGRGTNKPGDGDFDFMMRLDKAILKNPAKLQELKQTILKKLGKENSSEITGIGDFRLKGVQIDEKTFVDIDITFDKKTDKVTYSTDMSLQDRLETIKKIDPEKYKYVVANILLAKKVLKEAEAYKPDRGEVPQGGLGGVGIENWILQNGGSFIDAAKSLIEAARGKSFEEFKSSYQIWDFGENHLAEKKGYYPHDNFVSNNMSEEGYIKMVQALKKYIENLEKKDEQSKTSFEQAQNEFEEVQKKLQVTQEELTEQANSQSKNHVI